MAWELLLESCSPETFVVDELRLDSGAVTRVWSAAEVAGRAMQLPRDDKRVSGIARVAVEAERLEIAAGKSAAIYLWHDALPAELTHTIRITSARSSGDVSVSVALGSVATSVAPPLLGPGWFSSSAPANDSPHRRSFHRFATRSHVAQRYAIDFVRIEANGARFHGDLTKSESYVGYGATIVAIADGLVVSVKDGIPDNQVAACGGMLVVDGVELGPNPADPNSRCARTTAAPMTREKLLGNYVLVNHGKGRYATYAHLAPGSLAVDVGAKVVRGQMLAKVGNSGHSREPHLHFHVCDRPSTLECEGVPVQFERFVAIPVDPQRGQTGPPALASDAIPVSKSVLIFPDENGQLTVLLSGSGTF